MRTSSAKAKGRRLCALVKEKFLKAFPSLEDGDLKVTPSGVTGEDLWLSPLAKRTIPFCFEMKNQEKLNLWASLDQAYSHVDKNDDDDRIPILIFARNRCKPHVVIDLDAFIGLIKEDGNIRVNE